LGSWKEGLLWRHVKRLKRKKGRRSGDGNTFLFCHKQKGTFQTPPPIGASLWEKLFFSLFLLTAQKPYVYRMNHFILSSSSPFGYTLKTHRNLCCLQAQVHLLERL
jgi:hypothetical protein